MVRQKMARWLMHYRKILSISKTWLNTCLLSTFLLCICLEISHVCPCYVWLFEDKQQFGSWDFMHAIYIRFKLHLYSYLEYIYSSLGANIVDIPLYVIL